MKPTRSWIVVADGAQARILENTGPGKGLTALPGEKMQESHAPTREINADRPGLIGKAPGFSDTRVEVSRR